MIRLRRILAWVVGLLLIPFMLCLGFTAFGMLMGSAEGPGEYLIHLVLAAFFGLLTWVFYRAVKAARSEVLLPEENDPSGAEGPFHGPAAAAQPSFTNLAFPVILLAVASCIVIYNVIYAFPRLLYNDNKSTSKGNLSAIRSTLSIYYGDHQGQYPPDLGALTAGGKYLNVIPQAKTLHHPNSEAVRNLSGADFGAGKFSDSGGWAYVVSGSSDIVGTVVVNCTHTDSRGTIWTAY